MKSFQQYLFDVADNEFLHPPKCYSGRGMYGRECVSFTGSKRECRRIIGQVIKMANKDANMAIDLILDNEKFTNYTELINTRNHLDLIIDSAMEYSEDSMGHDMVIYWEDQDWVDDSESESDED